MILLILLVILTVALITQSERKIMGSMQRRIGPHKVGIAGSQQPFADGIKLIIKETIIPLESNNRLFQLSPLQSFYLALLNWIIQPLDHTIALSELYGGGILIIIAISELTIYGVLFSGWSANSKYPMQGSLRSTAQMISYSISLSIIILLIVLLSGSVDLFEILITQNSIGQFYRSL